MEKCYKDLCPLDFFAYCDDCERAGCVDHIVITSKYEQPFVYLCFDCLDKRREGGQTALGDRMI